MRVSPRLGQSLLLVQPNLNYKNAILPDPASPKPPTQKQIYYCCSCRLTQSNRLEPSLGARLQHCWPDPASRKPQPKKNKFVRTTRAESDNVASLEPIDLSPVRMQNCIYFYTVFQHIGLFYYLKWPMSSGRS